MVRFMCCQPATLYYAWQVEVMIKSFVNNGINLNHVDILCAVTKESDIMAWIALADNYAARVFFYKDDRPTPRQYVSSVRPWILAKHFEKHSYLSEEAIFYHDCDIALTKPINFSRFEEGDDWYGSDVRFYISHDYIIGKGEDVLQKMCEIVGISQDIVKNNELNCIGAQYLMKNIDSNFWMDVYRDSENLFRDITILNIQKKKENPAHHELQIWCADMWAVLWNGWKRGKRTIVDEELKFSWGNSSEQEWNKNAIFHNAGVTGPDQGFFYKALFQKSLPYDSNLDIKPFTASNKYYQLIKSVETKLLK
jgi:hypothetical protein